MTKVNTVVATFWSDFGLLGLLFIPSSGPTAYLQFELLFSFLS